VNQATPNSVQVTLEGPLTEVTEVTAWLAAHGLVVAGSAVPHPQAPDWVRRRVTVVPEQRQGDDESVPDLRGS